MFVSCFDILFCESSCQYQCKWVPGKTCLQNYLLHNDWVEWDFINTCSFTWIRRRFNFVWPVSDTSFHSCLCVTYILSLLPLTYLWMKMCAFYFRTHLLRIVIFSEGFFSTNQINIFHDSIFLNMYQMNCERYSAVCFCNWNYCLDSSRLVEWMDFSFAKYHYELIYRVYTNLWGISTQNGSRKFMIFLALGEISLKPTHCSLAAECNLLLLLYFWYIISQHIWRCWHEVFKLLFLLVKYCIHLKNFWCDFFDAKVTIIVEYQGHGCCAAD